jgi:hypothetical protein
VNPRAPANRDVERRLHGLAARAQEERERLVDILNENTSLMTDIQVSGELRVSVRESKATASPLRGTTGLIRWSRRAAHNIDIMLST